MQDKSSEIKIDSSTAIRMDVGIDDDVNETNQNNKENHVENSAATGLDDGDSSEDDELEAEEEEAICNPHIEIVISESEDEELS